MLRATTERMRQSALNPYPDLKGHRLDGTSYY